LVKYSGKLRFEILRKKSSNTNYMFFSKKTTILALLSGCLLTLSWPVSGLSFLIFFGLIPLLLLEHIISNDQKKRKKIRLFGNAFLCFFTWNLGTTWWIIN